MAKTLFVTGTDTEIGKTHVACSLLCAARRAGYRVAAFKPVAAGCMQTGNGPRNADALALMRAAALDVPYALVNPYALPDAIAPHLTAADTGVDIDLDHLADCHAALAARADLVVVEGAGGWAVPLGLDRAFPDLVAANGWPVLLVVGMRLGCINHALLSEQVITRTANCIGWVANCLPPAQPRLADNIASLQARLQTPLRATIETGATGVDAWHMQQIWAAI